MNSNAPLLRTLRASYSLLASSQDVLSVPCLPTYLLPDWFQSLLHTPFCNPVSCAVIKMLTAPAFTYDSLEQESLLHTARLLEHCAPLLFTPFPSELLMVVISSSLPLPGMVDRPG